MAEQHLEEFKSKIDRFQRDVESNFLEQATVIERRQTGGIQ
jgi:hypothetical protein